MKENGKHLAILHINNWFELSEFNKTIKLAQFFYFLKAVI